MEEQDKYYTPSIEEFHIGFEYEYLTDPRIPEKESSWDKCIIKDTNHFQSFLMCYEKDDFMEVRVKYLDKEDIESLGFELIDKKSSIIFDEPMEDYYRLYKLGNNYIEYNSWYTSEINSNDKRYPKKNEKYTIYSKQFIENENNFVTSTRFSGTIKNKSELKFILKSIGVLEENKI